MRITLIGVLESVEVSGTYIISIKLNVLCYRLTEFFPPGFMRLLISSVRLQILALITFRSHRNLIDMIKVSNPDSLLLGNNNKK